MSGTDCGLEGHEALPFMSESEHKARLSGEAQR